jgi:hypothetical protein
MGCNISYRTRTRDTRDQNTVALPVPVLFPSKNKNGGVGEPEYRLRELLSSPFPDAVLISNFPATMVPASVILPIGLILSGWAAQRHLPWIATDIVR